MAYATIKIPGDGSTSLIPVNFPLGVLPTEQITVTVTGEVTERTWIWVGTGMIQVYGTPASPSQAYIVKRRTPRTETLVNWMDGEPITENSLTVDQMQALHLIHEVLDGISESGNQLPPFEGNANKVLSVNNSATGVLWVPQGGGGGGGGIPDVPNDNVSYVRRNSLWLNATTVLTPISPNNTSAYVRKGNTWTTLVPEVEQILNTFSGTVAGYSSRAAAEGSDVSSAAVVLAVVQSDQVVFYRRFTGSAFDQAHSALITNSGTVYWNPAGDFTPLHWGAAGDGVVNDRKPIQDMFRFIYGPETNDNQVTAFLNQRPIVVSGMNRVFGIAAPVNLGNKGGRSEFKTGMIYRCRIHELSLKAIAGDWDFDYDTNMPRAMLQLAWDYGVDADDTKSGMYDVYFDHLRLDCNWLASGVYLQNTYQTTFYGLRVQHVGVGKFGVRTSVGRKADNPDGVQTLNGALTFVHPNIEGRVGEIYPDFPSGNTIETMGTTAMDIRTNDFRIDGVIASGCTTALDLYGRAGQIYNMHPWSRQVIVRATANNLMFANSYLDYTKFILESFQHKFVGMHWILPNATGSDRGVELRASIGGETGDGLVFSGCTFVRDLDIKYTTTGVGTWVGDKRRKVIIDDGCWFGPESTTAQIARYKNYHGITAATGAHWFSTGNYEIGEIRLVGDIIYVGKDRTVDGGASLQLQSKLGDQPTAGVYSFPGGGCGFYNSAAAGFLELATVNTPSALFIHGTTGVINVKNALTIENNTGAANAISAATGDIRAVGGGLSTNTKTLIAVTDTTPGFRATGSSCAVVNTPGQAATSAPLNLGRGEAGSLLRAACNGTFSAGAGIYITAAGVMSYVTSSDERLKQDFSAIDPNLVDQIGAYNFSWKSHPEIKDVGVKAQEVIKILPGAVTGSGNIERPDNAPEDWEPEYHGVDYAKLVPLLLAAVHDLRTRVSELERKAQ